MAAQDEDRSERSSNVRLALVLVAEVWLTATVLVSVLTYANVDRTSDAIFLVGVVFAAAIGVGAAGLAFLSARYRQPLLAAVFGWTAAVILVPGIMVLVMIWPLVASRWCWIGCDDF